MSVADKLLQLNQVKQDIKEAIENKGVDLTGVAFDGYAEKIDEIETGGGSSGGYTVTFLFMNMSFPDTKFKLANGSEFTIYGIYHSVYEPVVFENVTYIQCSDAESTMAHYRGITASELVAGKTLTNDIEIETYD